MLKTSYKWLNVGLFLVVASCTSPIAERIPGIEVMHFPFSMALMDHTLVMSTQSSDQKYSLGRLVAFNTNAIEQALSKARGKGPLPYADVVTANTLIKRDAGLINMNKSHIIVAVREDPGLYAVSRDASGFHCAGPEKKLSECPEASFLTLEGLDPYSVVIVAEDSANERILATYLASDRLDIVRLDKTKKTDALSLQKSFSASELMREKLGAKAIKNARFITRKAMLVNGQNPSAAKAYMLIEKYDDKSSTLQHSKGAYILSLLVSDLLRGRIEQFDLWDLSERYNIKGALDFYVDDKEEEALVLARDPESLYKIVFNDRTKYWQNTLCTGASMLAVSPAHDRIFVPCYSDNKVVSYKRSSLFLEAVSAYHGRGPAYIAVDENHKKIFVTYNNDGKVVVFDFDLAYEGHMFNEAPRDRIGS